MDVGDPSKSEPSSTRRVGQVKSGDWAFLGERRVERKDGGSVTQLALRMPWLLG